MLDKLKSRNQLSQSPTRKAKIQPRRLEAMIRLHGGRSCEDKSLCAKTSGIHAILMYIQIARLIDLGSLDLLFSLSV